MTKKMNGDTMRNMPVLIAALLASSLTASAYAAPKQKEPPFKRGPGPDIVIEGSVNEVLVGGGTGMAARRVSWRHRQLIMYPDWAVEGTPGGACKVQVIYTISNLGNQETVKPFTVQILNNKKVVAEDVIQPLKPGEHREVFSHALFTNGHNWLTLRLDGKNEIAESIETNNEVKFDYTMNGKCKPDYKAKLPPRAVQKMPSPK
jgi:hypothetical protein